MKLIMRNIPKICSLVLLLGISQSCNTLNLDINTDPNNPTNASNKLLLTSVENGFINTFDGVNYDMHGFVGILANNDGFNLTNSSYTGTWNFFYSGPAQDLEGIIRSATVAGNNPHYLGIAQVIKAHFYGMMVDLFGDIPYSEAVKGDASSPITAPKYDKAEDIYTDLIKLCDDAVTNFGKPSPISVTGDLIYNGNISKWTSLAKTVKLRLLLNSRLGRANGNADVVAAFGAGGLITNPANDFTYRYNNLNNPDGRHPWFQNAYLADNGFPYVLNQFMLEMLENKDPRVNFYFKRQAPRPLDLNDQTEKGSVPSGYLVYSPKAWERLIAAGVFPATPTEADTNYLSGFFGRQRGDAAGVPADGAYRVAPGTYPAGGLYDDRTIPPVVRTGNNTPSTGSGLLPLITSTNVKFYQIEAILVCGLSGDARAVFKSAIEESITRVVNFGLAIDPTNAKAPAPQVVTDYVNNWLARYDAASSNSAKLDVVLKQAWFSNFGSAFDTYNAFRRTGFPSSLDKPIAAARQFALRLPYPADEIALNPNAKDKGSVAFDKPENKLFWDKIGFQF
jgi:hypothetical protein